MSCTCALRCILGLINTLIGIVALVVTVAGGLLAWGLAAVKDVLNRFFLRDVVEGSQEDQIRTVAYKILELTAPLGIILFSVALVVFMICLFGIIGACCESKFMLNLYLILHGILITAEIVLIIIYFARPDIALSFGEQFFNGTVHKYVSITSKDSDSVFLAIIMPLLECCGVNGGRDFDHVSSFQRKVTYEGQSYTLMYPISCCKFDKSFQIVDRSCPRTFDMVNSNINTGCWPIIEANINKYMKMTAYIACGVMIFQAILIFFACVVVCTNPKVKPL